MKKHTIFICILIGISLLLLNISCKKSNDSNSNNQSAYYLKFKLDGVQKDFKFFAQVLFNSYTQNGHPIYKAEIGSGEVFGGGNILSIELTSENPIVIEKAYTDHLQIDTADNARLTYGNNYVEPLYESYIPALATINTTVNVTLSEIASTYIKGTFSGKVYGTTVSSFHQISDGEFYLKISQ